MQEYIYLQLGERMAKKPFQVIRRSKGVFPWPSRFRGFLTDLTQNEALQFLAQDCRVDAGYKAHGYRVKLLEREGRFVATMKVPRVSQRAT